MVYLTLKKGCCIVSMTPGRSRRPESRLDILHEAQNARGGGALSLSKHRGVRANIFMNRKSPRITAVELLRALKRDGWVQARQSGSHIILKHPEKAGRVIVPNHAGVVLKQKTLDENLERAGLTKDRLRALLEK